MSDTAIDTDFADGHYRFWLPIARVVEIERNCGAPRFGESPAVPKSIFVMYDQLGGGLGLADDKPVYLGGGEAILTDVREIIRCALIGGNSGVVDKVEIEVGPHKAKELVDGYVYPERPLVEGVYLAWAILHRAITGIDLKKKPEASAVKRPRSAKAK
jgi:hypothetical protein